MGVLPGVVVGDGPGGDVGRSRTGGGPADDTFVAAPGGSSTAGDQNVAAPATPVDPAVTLVLPAPVASSDAEVVPVAIRTSATTTTAAVPTTVMAATATATVSGVELLPVTGAATTTGLWIAFSSLALGGVMVRRGRPCLAARDR